MKKRYLLFYFLICFSEGLANDPIDHLGNTARRRKSKFDQVNPTDVVNRLNTLMRETWRKSGLPVSPPASDDEFVRRAYLDIAGRVPSPEEREEFIKARPEKRRGQLCEKLVASEDSKNYWSILWARWFTNRLPEQTNIFQFNTFFKKAYETLDFQMDLVAREILAPELSPEQRTRQKAFLADEKSGLSLQAKSAILRKVQANGFISSMKGSPDALNPELSDSYDMHPLTESVGRNLLGIRLECVRCHDHPLGEKWKQTDYWNLNATFRAMSRAANSQTSESIDKTDKNFQVKFKASGDQGSSSDEPTLVARPTFLDGKPLDLDSKPGPHLREQLALRIVRDPLFAKALVNRVWATMFGWGMNAPSDPDDFRVNANHELEELNLPEVMDELSKDFASAGFRPHKLMEWICKSEAYQLTSRSLPGNQTEKGEHLFTRMPVKPMSLSQLLRSVEQITGTFTDAEVYEEGGFYEAHGNTAQGEPNIQQQLTLLNDGRHARHLHHIKDVHDEASPEAIDHAFVRVLGRKPTSEEKKRALAFSVPPSLGEKVRALISQNFELQYLSYQRSIGAAEARGLNSHEQMKRLEDEWSKLKTDLAVLVQKVRGKSKSQVMEAFAAFKREHEYLREISSSFIPYLNAKSNLVELYLVLLATNEFRANH